jgi:hypothetical protein
MKKPTLSTEQAAAAIVALINARAQSPTQAEIADIIARHVGSDVLQIQGTSAIHVEIHTLLRDLDEAERSIGRNAYASDEEIDATFPPMHKRLKELQDQLPQLPRSMADCVAFAEIAQHWHETDPADVDSFLRAARPLVAGIHRHMKSRVADVPSEAIKLCRQGRGAALVDLDTEGTPAHAAARLEADKCKFEIERLRSRLAAKSPKTLDDIAALTVLAVYWEPDLLEEFIRKHEEDRIAIGDRSLCKPCYSRWPNSSVSMGRSLRASQLLIATPWRKNPSAISSNFGS